MTKPEIWLVWAMPATDSLPPRAIFLAFRYDRDGAVRAAWEFQPRWPEHVVKYALDVKKQ